jgi:ferrous iron transport protein A
MPLSNVKQGARVRLETLPAHPVLVQRLRALGVQPGAEIEVVRRGRPGGILHLACGFLEFMLRHEHAREMNVRPCQP